MSANTSDRVAEVTASARSLPALMCSIDVARVSNITDTCPARRSVSAGPPPPIRYVEHFHAGHHLEQLAVHMLRAPDAARRHIDLTGIGLGISDQPGNGLRWERRVHHQDPWSAAQARDRREVADKIEAEVVVQGRVERIDRRNVEQRGAVRDRAHDCFGGDIAAGARPILDDEWLTETLRQRLTDQACKEVRRAAA